jgi:Phage terminase large subunit (GpA)
MPAPDDDRDGHSIEIDIADEDLTPRDLAFMLQNLHFDRHALATLRLDRRVFCTKGAPGFARLPLVRAKLKKGKPLFIIGVDAIKSQLFAKLDRGRTVRFSSSLPGEYFEQLTSERRITRLVRGKPTMRF